MTEVQLFDTRRSEVTVWDTGRNIVWGPRPQPDPPDPNWPFPETADPLVQQARPATWAVVYDVAADGSGDFTTVSAALNAEQGRREAAQIRGAGPQDYAILRIHPGVYEEKIRSFAQWALVGVSGERDDVLITADMDPEDGATLAATQSLYIENVTFSSTYSGTDIPPPADTRATVWNSNAAPDTTMVFINVRTESNNAVLNSCAMQPSNRNTYLFYRCRFETNPLPSQVRQDTGFQPFNVQTGMGLRVGESPDPALGADVICIDCEVETGSDHLVAGVTDLGGGTYDRIVWTGGGIAFDPSWQTAAWFHSKYHYETDHDIRDYFVQSWCSPQVPYAGEAVDGVDLHWEEPADLADWLPTGAVGPLARPYFYPQALDTIGEIRTGSPTGSITMQPGRWYFIPVSPSEARTLAGFSLNVTSYSGAGGNLSAGVWECPPHLGHPTAWVSRGSSAPLKAGVVEIHRGTYRNARLYPGALLWVGVMADQACTVAAAHQTRVFYQDSATVPSFPTPSPLATGLAPAPVVKTGVV